MRDPFARDVEFRRLIQQGHGVDLARVNLEISRDAYPELEIEPYLEKIGALAARVRDRCSPGGGPRSFIGQINWVMFVEEGFRGNTDDYYDPRNSYLNEVIDRKMGIPISLSILYAAVAALAGFALGGVNVPIHFLLKVMGWDQLYVDAYHEGRMMDLPGCEQFLSHLAGRRIRLDAEQFSCCEDSITASRMLHNLKGIYLEGQDYASALPVARRLAALNRDDLAEQRDWGLICVRADRPGEALIPLQRYLDADPDARDVASIREMLKAARREVAFRN